MPTTLSIVTLHKIAQVLADSGVFAYPTEAVYGLGCLPHDAIAVKRLLDIKQRCVSKGLIVVAADLAQLDEWIDRDPAIDWQRIQDSWPGHVSWLLPTTAAAPPWVTGGHSTLAVRVSAHPLVRQLCEHFGPLVSTSANPAGKPPALNRLQVRRYFGDSIFCTPGSLLGADKPSQIRDARTFDSIRG